MDAIKKNSSLVGISRNCASQINLGNSKEPYFHALSLSNFDLRTLFSAVLYLMEITCLVNYNAAWFWNPLSSRKSQGREHFVQSTLRSPSSFVDPSESSDHEDEGIESEDSWGQFVELTEEPKIVPCDSAQ
mmetsp:Transcript_4755/g.7214  ORF Transcript_4755/g.7214 Transcript_4755/m.7214 type:complete len:131 (-) Transcript_4755:233-625(-)